MVSSGLVTFWVVRGGGVAGRDGRRNALLELAGDEGREGKGQEGRKGKGEKSSHGAMTKPRLHPNSRSRLSSQLLTNAKTYW